jgi:hypothetical protein
MTFAFWVSLKLSRRLSRPLVKQQCLPLTCNTLHIGRLGFLDTEDIFHMLDLTSALMDLIKLTADDFHSFPHKQVDNSPIFLLHFSLQSLSFNILLSFRVNFIREGVINMFYYYRI